MHHRDVKLENVLVDDDGNVLTSDFGLASVSPTPFSTAACGTGFYASPQVLKVAFGKQREHDLVSSDYWAVGVCLHALLSGDLPFKGNNMFAEINAADYEPLPANISQGTCDLVDDLLDVDEATRWKLPQIRAWAVGKGFTVPEPAPAAAPVAAAAGGDLTAPLLPRPEEAPAAPGCMRALRGLLGCCCCWPRGMKKLR